jgi:energy-coupling factor transporter ATP-binding protein EcfA2
MLNQPLQSGESNKSSQDVIIDIQPGAGNPFPGLRPFTIEESHLFFGREGQVDEILVKLSKNHFLTVLGYSGSGKSSLMYCGLIPVLYGGFVTQTGPSWHVIPARPGTSPISNLADSAVQYLIEQNAIDTTEKEVHRAIFSSVLRSGPSGLVEISRMIQRKTGENVFFLVDQFEEIFRFRESETGDTRGVDEAQHYVNLILNAISQRDVPVYVALTMRSDFLGKCSVFPRLTSLINESNYLVPHRTREQKRAVIEGPITVAGGKISPRLAKRILNDVSNDQDQLPILQHALMRTWDYWIENREPGEPIDIRHYNAIGKISEALSIHANEAYDELTTREKEIAEILFKSVTEKNQDNRGMRRPVRVDLVAELAGAGESEVISVVNHFRRAGRSFLMPAENVKLHRESIVELSHESLMRIWVRLESWVDEEFESAQMYKRLSEAAAMYQIGKTGLWRPPDLQLALNWQQKQKPIRAWAQRYDEAFERAIVFLDTSRITYEAELKNQEMMQRRVLRRTRITAIILGIAAIIAILFMVFAYIKKIEADRQTDLAIERGEEAERQRNFALIERNRADSLRGEAVKAADNLAKANASLEVALAERTAAELAALVNLQEAKRQQGIAESASNAEKEARIFAEDKTREAEREYNRANRLLMLTKAQAMAAKSRQESDDKDLAGLLAMQAYHFHKKYDGNHYDPYIYAGLYYSLTKLENKAYNAIKIQGPPRNRINAVSLASTGNKFYASGADGRIFEGDYLKLTSKPTGYGNPYPSKVIALSNDQRFIVNGSDSSFVQIYDINTEGSRPAKTIEGFNGPTNDIEFIPNGTGFVVASGDFKKTNYVLSIVDHQSGAKRGLVTLPLEVKNISISPDGNWLAGGTWSGKIFLVDLKTGSYSTLVEETSSRILAVKRQASRLAGRSARPLRFDEQ